MQYLGGENGFNQAIELAADCLSNVKFIREKKLLSQYFGEISKDSGKYVYGVNDTLSAMSAGAVEELIVWENLDIQRLECENKMSGEKKLLCLTEEQEKNKPDQLKCKDGSEFEIMKRESLLDWLVENAKGSGAKINFITNRSQEGSQFCKGFGGIGGLMRYSIEIDHLNAGEDDEEEIEIFM